MWRSLAPALALALVLSVVVGRAQAPAPLTPQDHVAIQQLYAQYAFAIDTADAEGWAATFVPDGVFNETNRGRAALVQFVRNWHATRDGAHRRHVTTNLLITPTAEGARGSAYLTLVDIGTRPAAIALTGVYDDVLVKTADGWRFRSRVIRTDPAPRPAP